MCSIYGCIGHRKRISRTYLNEIRENAKDRGRDGGRTRWYSIGEGTRIAALGNWRATPTPESAEGNLQPYDGIVHNGTIANAEELGLQPGEIDSEILPRVLKRDSLYNFAGSLSQLKGSFAIAALGRTRNGNHTIYLACNYKPLWYWAPPLPAKHGRTTYFSSMKRHFRSLQTQRRTRLTDPVQLEPYTAMDLETQEIIQLPCKYDQKKIVVVASAGLDSTVVAADCVRLGMDVCLLHFVYGCKAEGREVQRIRAIADRLKCDLRIIELPFRQFADKSTLFGGEIASGIAGAEYAYEWVPARNMVFLSLAVAFAEANGYHNVAAGTNLEESVTGDTKVSVLRNGVEESVAIAELYESRNSNELSVLSCNKDGKVSESKVSAVLRHKSSYKKLLKITDSLGRNITVTPCHSVMVWKNDSLCSTNAAELKEGDVLATPRFGLEGKRTRVIRVPRRSLPSHLIFDSRKQLFRSKTRKNWFPLNLKVDSLLAEFFGYWIGDGSYDKQSIILSLGKDAEELEERLVAPIAKRWGCNYQIKENGDCWINLAVAKYAMQACGFTGDCYTKKVPFWVHSLPRKTQAAFLRGYFSADGTFTSGDVSLHSCNRELLDAAQTMLVGMGIPSRINGNDLEITEARIEDRFMQKVGFILGRKSQKAGKHLERVLHHSQLKPHVSGVPWTDAIPESIQEQRYVVAGTANGGPRQAVPRNVVTYFLGRSRDQRRGMVDRDRLKELAHHTRNENLKRTAECDLWFSHVEAIEEVDSPEYVYDLSVPGDENFALANGILVHNSGSYPDNEEQFVLNMDAAAAYATQNGYRVKIVQPVGNLMKHEIVARGMSIGAPLDLTWSCYRDGDKHCGQCGPCFMRKEAFARNGLRDPVFED